MEGRNLQTELRHELARKTHGRRYVESRNRVALTEESFNRPVAEAYRDGMMRLWRVVKPARPIRKPGGAITKQFPVILAFASIGIEAAEDAEWATRLTEKEAALVVRHACRTEENYPEWIDSLVMSWPKSVLPVIKEQIEFEWTATAATSTYFLPPVRRPRLFNSAARTTPDSIRHFGSGRRKTMKSLGLR